MTFSFFESLSKHTDLRSNPVENNERRCGNALGSRKFGWLYETKDTDTSHCAVAVSIDAGWKPLSPHICLRGLVSLDSNGEWKN